MHSCKCHTHVPSWLHWDRTHTYDHTLMFLWLHAGSKVRFFPVKKTPVVREESQLNILAYWILIQQLLMGSPSITNVFPGAVDSSRENPQLQKLSALFHWPQQRGRVQHISIHTQILVVYNCLYVIFMYKYDMNFAMIWTSPREAYCIYDMNFALPPRNFTKKQEFHDKWVCVPSEWPCKNFMA